MKRKSAMAFPSSAHSSSFSSGSAAGAPSRGPEEARRLSARSQATPAAGGLSPSSRFRCSEGEHRLEKLEFALAVALSRKDLTRVQHLRDQIDALGGNAEEPGT